MGPGSENIYGVLWQRIVGFSVKLISGGPCCCTLLDHNFLNSAVNGVDHTLGAATLCFTSTCMSSSTFMESLSKPTLLRYFEHLSALHDLAYAAGADADKQE